LQDNWSQVRYAASKCARSFYNVAKDQQDMRDLYDKDMIPKMCLNRYYVAEGVRVYSIETWRNVFAENGR
jgi:hypothetical protein